MEELHVFVVTGRLVLDYFAGFDSYVGSVSRGETTVAARRYMELWGLIAVKSQRYNEGVKSGSSMTKSIRPERSSGTGESMRRGFTR